MRKTVYIFLMAMAAIALTGCVSTKEIAYLQGAETLTAEELAQQTVPLYDARIMPVSYTHLRCRRKTIFHCPRWS